MIHQRRRTDTVRKLLSLCLALTLLWGLCPRAAAQEAPEMGAAQEETQQTDAEAAEIPDGTPSAGAAEAGGMPAGGPSGGAGEETPAEEPAEETEEKPAEEPEELGKEPTEESGEEPTDQPEEEPAEPGENPAGEDPAAEPEEESEEESETPIEQPPEDLPEEPVEEMAEPVALLAAADVGIVTDGLAANTDIRVDLFNYSAAINPESSSDTEYALRFYNTGAWPARDGTGDNAQTYLGGSYRHGSMSKVLGSDGYPVYGERSLRYLFDTSLPAGAAGGYRGAVTHYALNANSGLFRNAGGGYLEYDSARNAAWYDPERNRFTLYDGVVRPGHTEVGGDDDAADKNFLPFNGADEFREEPAGQTPRRYTLEKGAVDLWFGMSLAFDFYMPQGGTVSSDPMVFEFMGDDDVWVYIDDVLVLDIGGTHAAQRGTIDFQTGQCVSPQSSGGKAATLKALFTQAGRADGVQWDGETFADYSRHTFRFFYMERGGNISYCKLRFNLPTLPQQSLTVGKELEADSGQLDAFLRDKYAYRFRVLCADGDGNPMEQLYVTPGTSYALLEHGAATGITGTADAEGYITLKAGQQAQIENMLRFSREGACTRYVVEERMPDEVSGQYGDILYSVAGSPGTRQTGENPGVSFTGYTTDALSAGESQIVVYRNTVRTEQLGRLSITKRTEGVGVPEDTVFAIRVTLGGVPLAEGFAYTVDGAARTAENGCVQLKSGETAVIAGILAGTVYQVTEPEQPGIPQGTFTLKSIAGGSGTVGVGGTAAVTVINAYTPCQVGITVSKQVAGELGDREKAFRFTCRYQDGDGAVQTVIFDLKHGQSRTAVQVPVGTEVTVAEESYPGYETTVAVNGGAAQTGREAAVQAGTAGGAVVFVNRKEAAPDTGVSLMRAPLIPAAMISACGALVLRRRRR